MPILFKLGVVVATPAALVALAEAEASPLPLLVRHAAGDWRELCEPDRQANHEALVTGARVLSVYTLSNDTVIWIITDAADDDGQRHCTTILLPSDY